MRRARKVIAMVGVLVGVVICVWPIVADVMCSLRMSEMEQELVRAEGTDEEREFYLRQARAYNDVLAGIAVDVPDGGLIPYDDQLSWQGKPYMSYLKVPVAHISMPVWHGCADPELASGAGHLEGTSLPVGGSRALCVLEGHSGMMTSRMFDDIRSLAVGDVACLWTLAEPYAYRVESMSVVMPDDVAALAHEMDGDKLMLVTCTSEPDFINRYGRIGVNDRRLVVTLSRCEYDPAAFGEESSPVIEAVTSPRARLPIVGLVVVLLAFVLHRLWVRRRVVVQRY